MIDPDNATTDGNADYGQNKSGNEGADDADNDIADQTKTEAFHNLSGQPAGNSADKGKPINPKTPRSAATHADCHTSC